MSAWGDFVNSAVEVGSAGVDAYNTVTGRPTPAAAPAAAPASGLPSWALPAAVIAGVAILLLVVLKK